MICRISAYSEVSGAFLQYKMQYFTGSKKKIPLAEASLVMPNGDPRKGFFYPILTFMVDSHILSKIQDAAFTKCYY